MLIVNSRAVVDLHRSTPGSDVVPSIQGRNSSCRVPCNQFGRQELERRGHSRFAPSSTRSHFRCSRRST